MSAAERKIIEYTQLQPGVAPLAEMAANYSQTWANSGINIRPYEAQIKIASFIPEYTHMLLDPVTKELLGQIHTIPVYTASLKDFIGQFRTYQMVERAARKQPYPDPNFVICFSLNCKPGYFVKTGERAVPLPEFVVKNFPAPERAYKIGFSFITMQSPLLTDADSMFKRYRELIQLENTRGGGPAMMHEAFGGIVVAFLPNARPEHALAGGGITLVVYPRNKAQAEYFERIKTRRRIEQIIQFERFNDTIILKDVQLHIPLKSL